MSRSDDPQLSIILDRFDAAWEGGAAPEIADILPDEADESQPSRASVLMELVMIDLERRWRAGTSEAATLPSDAEQFPAKPTLEDYLARHPELGPLESLPVTLICEEYRVRRRWGDRPGHEEYLRRFPTQSTELGAALAKIDSEASIDAATVTSPPPDGLATNYEDVTIPPETAGMVADPSAGDRVRYFGEYELLDEIARGGMGVVFKARQVKLNRIVALKMILSGELAGEEEVQRFKTEAEAAANLDHSGIVPIYEIGEHQGQHYFSMGFVEGESLADRVKDGPLPPRQAAEIVKKVAEAVAYAHEKGVIHRDLKPANVLLDANDEPRVTDFGLAKQVESDSDLTRTGAVMGTPSYMPPEQAGGKTDEVGSQSDIYSLGAILYCLLTGRPPFQSANPMDVLLQVLEKEPVSPRILNPTLEKDLETICLTCLSKETYKRYDEATAVAAELDRYLSGEPIKARPISRPERAWRWCRRNPIVAGLGATVLVSLFAGIIVSAAFARVASINAQRAGESADLANSRADKLALKTEELNLANDDLNRSNDELKTALNARDQALRDKEIALSAEKRERNRAEWQLYANQLGFVQRDWESGDIQVAWEQLNACRWDFRAWEHDYLHTLVRSNRRRFLGHRSGVGSVSFSRSGKRIVSGSWDDTVKVWDAETGHGTLSLEGHEGTVNCVAFSPDGKRIVSGSRDKTVRVWDAHTGRETLTLRGHSKGVDSVVFSRDGRRILSGSSDTTLKVWNAQTGQIQFTLEGHTKKVFADFSPDGQWIASGSLDGTLRMWNAVTGEETRVLEGHTDAINAVAFSPDGTRIVSASDDNTLVIWDAETGQMVSTLKGHSFPVMCVAYSRDGKQIVSAGEGTIRVWDAISGDLTGTLSVGGMILDVSFSPGGRQVATCALADSAVSVWDLTRTRKSSTLEGAADRLLCLALSSRGQLIVSGHQDGNLSLFNASNGQALRTLLGHAGPVLCAAFSTDEKLIATGSFDKTVKVWNVETGKPTVTLEGHSGHVKCVAFGPEGSRVVSAATISEGEDSRNPFDCEIKVWEAQTGQEILKLAGGSAIESLAFSPDGKRIAGGFLSDGSVKVWDVGTGNEVLTLSGHSSAVGSVIFSPEGHRIVSGSKEIKVWDANSGTELFTLEGHKGVVGCLAFSPDGTRIISGSEDGMLKIWNATTGTELLTLRGHNGSVDTLTFEPDGKRLITGSRNRTVMVWDASRGSDTMTLPTGAEPLAFSPNGALIACKGNNDIRVLDATTGRQIWSLKGRPVRTLVAFSPDNTHLASVTDAMVRLRDVRTGQERVNFEHVVPGNNAPRLPPDVPTETAARVSGLFSRPPIDTLAFSSNGQWIATAGGSLGRRTLHVWDALTGESQSTLTAAIGFKNIDFSPDGKRIVSDAVQSRDDRPGALRVWDVATGEELLRIKVNALSHQYVAFSPDGERIVSSSRDDTLKVWDASTGQSIATLTGSANGVNSFEFGFAFDRKGRSLVSTGNDNNVRIWNLETSAELLTFRGDQRGVRSFVLYPIGMRVVGFSHENTYKVWSISEIVQQATTVNAPK